MLSIMSCVGGFGLKKNVQNDAEGAQNIYRSKSDLATRLADNDKNEGEGEDNNATSATMVMQNAKLNKSHMLSKVFHLATWLPSRGKLIDQSRV